MPLRGLVNDRENRVEARLSGCRTRLALSSSRWSRAHR